ncbi:MAG: zinc metallopeptidase, partial [Clostridia bacterium]|nr:zinc metallopeptidase [Clostridia bacterium]
EREGAKKVLTAAAMTYVVALATALVNLLRFAYIFLGRGRRR